LKVSQLSSFPEAASAAGEAEAAAGSDIIAPAVFNVFTTRQIIEAHYTRSQL
jgi:hypothetical protein